MSRTGYIFAIALALMLYATAHAQLKVVPKEKLMAVASPKLSPDSASLDFDVRHIVAPNMSEDDASAEFSYTFRNVGSGTLRIRALRTTCSCASAVCDRTEVRPGETAVISVRYNPKGHPGKFERRVFVYTQDGPDPAAVLTLEVEVDSGQDFSREYPVQMGSIRLRRNSVNFDAGLKAVEKIRFINLSGRPLTLKCEEMFLPESISFETRPATVEQGSEGEIVISYKPDGEVVRKNVKLMLKGLGVPPSQSAIRITIE